MSLMLQTSIRPSQAVSTLPLVKTNLPGCSGPNQTTLMGLFIVSIISPDKDLPQDI